MEDCAFKVTCMPDDTSIEGNASAIDDETDKAICNSIREELDSGNQWAWCTVIVTCYYDGGRLHGITGKDCLGGCSYKDEQGFVDGGYFEDMKRAAYDNFVAAIESL